MAVNLRLRIAYATAAQWTAWDGILKAGQIGWESDTGKFKVGDNATTWTALAYSHYTIDEITGLLASKSDTGHNHDDRYFTEAEVTAALAGKSNTGHTHVKADITDFAHTHPISEVVNLQTTLDAKEVTANKATDFSVINDTKFPSVEAVKEQLDLKSNTGHTHIIGDTTGLQAALDAKELLANKATDFSTVNDTKYPTVEAVKEYVDPLVAGLLDDRGNYDASVNTFPAAGGSGGGGAILKGDTWYISVAGTLGGVAVGIGDTIRSLVDTPGQTASNWAILEGNIGYVPENVANKDTDGTLSANSDTKYPSQKAVKTYADTKAPAVHSHAIADVTNLQTELDGKVDENAPITGATKTKITYDAKGLVTGGADATTADIADSSNRRYLTDAQQTVVQNTSGVNTGDQTSIVGISGTKAQFDTAVTDGNILFVGDIVAATDAASGIVELATLAELETGTDTGRVITPDVLAGSNFGERVVEILVSDPGGDAITTGDGKAYFRVPSSMNGMNLVEVAMSLTTASSSGVPTVQIRNATQTADMLTTKLTIDASETDSSTAAAAAVIDGANDDVATGDKIHIDIDVAGTGAKGLLVEMIFRLP